MSITYDSQETVTNALLLEQDKAFNKSYSTMNELNTVINNKEELLNIENKLIAEKNNKIGILTTILYALILLFIVITVHASGKLNKKQTFASVIGIIIIAFIYMYLKYIKNYQVKLALLSVATAKGFKELAERNLAMNVKPYKCPYKCGYSSDDVTESVPVDTSTNLDAYGVPKVVPINSVANVWIKGDHPESTFTTPKFHSGVYQYPPDLPIYRETPQQETLNQPQKFIKTINPAGATYYDCVWNNPSDTKAIPYYKTTIPCTYLDGYVEQNKYICTTEPTQTKGEQANCTNVTTY